MSLAALCLLTFVVQAEPEEKSKEPISFENDAYIRASDLGIEKWSVNATIGGDSVLSIIKVTRYREEKELDIDEIVEYRAVETRVEQSIVIIDQENFSNSRGVLIKSPISSHHLDRAKGELPFSGSEGGWKLPDSDIRSIGFYGVQGDAGEKILIAFYARVGKLDDYPKLKEHIEKSKPKEWTWARDFGNREIPKAIRVRLDSISRKRTLK